jgi:hypothetical protein
MKKNSQYPSNKATGKIDLKTLKKFADPYFGLEDTKLLENKDIAEDVKEAYKKFVSGEIDNNGQDYVIVSKTDCYLYLFTKDHKLMGRQITLLGSDIEKNTTRTPYDYYSTNKGVIYHTTPTNTDTPEELFKIRVTTAPLASNYTCDGPKIALVLVPVNKKTQKTEARYEYDKYMLEIHPVYQPQGDPTKYQDAINSTSTEDNYISHGCINIKDF